MKKLMEQMAEELSAAFEKSGYDPSYGKVTVSNRPDLCEFQCNGAMAGAKAYKKAPFMIADDVVAYLKDSQQPPYSYKGSLRGLLEHFIAEHNKCVEKQKQFTVGEVTVVDNNDYVSYSCSSYSQTLDAIREKLINTHGGYLRLRYTADGKVLDYLEDFTEASLQKVEFGKNLTDVKITCDYTERVTALIPLGAKITSTDDEGNEVETDERVDITSVNGGRNYVFDEAAVEEAGWIWATEVWDDVTLPGNLLRKAQARIVELAKGITSMELTIVDESDTGADIADIHARQYVYCSSPPHGIEGRYLCIQRTRDYLNPSGNTITIGASGIKLTSLSAKQNRNLNSLEQQTEKLEGIYGKVESITESKMYRTDLVMEGMSIFRDKGQRSKLSCRVFSWDKDITADLPDSAFCWHRKSGNTEADADWDGLHKGKKTITISTEDVLDNASFFCEVTI